MLTEKQFDGIIWLRKRNGAGGEVMVDSREIKRRIQQMRLNQRIIAEKMGLCPSTVSKKINESFGESFSIKEAEQIIKLLQIENPSEYFFTKKGAYTQQTQKHRGYCSNRSGNKTNEKTRYSPNFN